MTPVQRRSDSPTGTPPLWRDLSHRFVDDRDCLAAFLALETAEILEGVKPANLVNLVNRKQGCGRNLYRLWKSVGPVLLDSAGLHYRELCDRGSSLLVLIYHPAALEALVADRRVSALLRQAGYNHGDSLEKILSCLEKRLGPGSFPHEIGVLLGYPLKDVAAFMGLAQIPFTCQGPWRIFGDPRSSLRLAETHRDCRHRMAWQIADGRCPLECLRRAA